MECLLEDVIDTLRHHKTTLLIGSGCSTNGGIPDSKNFVELIKQQYPSAYNQAYNDNYHQCMAALSLKQRNQLICDHITTAKINWTHTGIAQLIKNGYVDRVLTTSFDPLLVRACAMIGIFPAVYDLSVKQEFDIDNLSTPAILYLHGQKEACIQLDSKEQHDKYLKNFAPLFTNAGQKESWIVAGYSGNNDPAFSLLTQVDLFKNNLYWVTHGDTPPPSHVDQKLINTEKNAFLIKGYNCDEFFTELIKGLDCFPPSFVKHPLSSIDNDIDPEPQAHQKKAPPTVTSEQALISDAHKNLKQGHYDKVIATRVMYSAPLPPPLRTLTSWAHLMKANQITYKMKNSSLDESRKQLSLAGSEYRKALELQPQMHTALNNWGVAIARYAKQLENDEANTFFILAAEKFQAALNISPKKYTTLNNWGSALSEQAQRSTGKTSKRLFQMANNKFQLAHNINKDAEEVLYNWGNSLFEQAKKTKTNRRSIKLYQHAAEKYQQALNINPNNSDILCNWALTLAFQAHRVPKEETADCLYEQANVIYKIILEPSPDEHKSLNRHNILNQWGVTLMNQAKTKSLTTKHELLKIALEKFMLAESIQQGSASYNLACLYAIQNDPQECYKWLKKLDECNILPEIEKIQNDDDLLNITETEWFQNFMDEKENNSHKIAA